MKKILANEVTIHRLRQTEIEKLKIIYNRKPDAFKKMTSFLDFIDSNLDESFLVKNNKQITKKRFVGRKFR